MIYLRRDPPPDFWTRERVKVWTQHWLAKDCESTRWDWFQFEGKELNQHAREAMAPWHHGKCAFCEKWLGESEEIEHFRSKTRHPLAAFVWRNLFLICRACNQAKGVENHEGCLKPDREDPADYLWVNPILLKVEPKPGISNEARRRATITIKRYGLDRPELKRLYEVYLHKELYGGSILEFARLVYQASENDPEPVSQIPFLRAKLQALATSEQPFSLMVKSCLEY